MSTQVFSPGYRLTLFSPSSETVVFTPDAGADHSEAFQVTTLAGVANFQDYMTPPKARKSRFDPVKKKLDIGEISVTILDKRLTPGGTNFQRWVTAFIGDDTGKARMLGLKAYMEETTDGGVTWLPFYVGRVRTFNLTSLNGYLISIKEDNEQQNLLKVFTGEPSSSLLESTSYGNRHQMVPWGPDNHYGLVGVREQPIGTWRNAANFGNRAIELDADNAINWEEGVAQISKPLTERIPEVDKEDAWKRESNIGFGPIVRVIQGSTVGRYHLTYVKGILKDGPGVGPLRTPVFLHSILLEEIESDEFEHASLSAFVVGSTVRFQIITDNEEPSDKFPLLVDNVTPGTFWRDILAGLWSTKIRSSGVAQFSGSIAIDDAQFTNLTNNKQLKDSRWIIKKPEKMSTFIEDHILKPYNLGYRLEPTASFGVPKSVVVPFSMELPLTSSGIPTITQDDLKVGTSANWAPGKPFIRFESKFYRETITTVDSLLESNAGQEGESVFDGPANPTLISEFPITFTTVDIDNVHGGDGEFKIDARGIRFFGPSKGFPELFVDSTQLPFIFTRERVMTRLMNKLHEDAVFRWSRGPATVKLEARRTGSTNDLKIGDWRIIDVDFLPDPFTHRRGGARLMQCVERSENGPSINFRLVDSGQDIQRTAPTVGSFDQVGNTSVASGSMSIAQDNRIETHFAVTSQSVVDAPAVTASAWQFANRTDIAAGATASVVVGDLPAGSHVFIRARSVPPRSEDLQLPSDWAFPPAPGFFDMGATTAPSQLEVDRVTETSARATWVNGNTTQSIEVRLQADSSSSFDTVGLVQGGTTEFPIEGISNAASENPYTLRVRHINPTIGEVSDDAEILFSAKPGTLPKAPTPRGIIIITDGDQITPVF